jgi:hypothetical protein
MKKEETTNINKRSEYKNPFALNEQLDEVAPVYGTSAQTLSGVYEECFDCSVDYVWKRLCTNVKPLDEATLHDKNRILELLPQIHTAKHAKNAQSKEEEDVEFKRKPQFENNGRLYIEILTVNEEYKFAYLNGGGVCLVLKCQSVFRIAYLLFQIFFILLQITYFVLQNLY